MGLSSVCNRQLRRGIQPAAAVTKCGLTTEKKSSIEPVGCGALGPVVSQWPESDLVPLGVKASTRGGTSMQ